MLETLSVQRNYNKLECPTKQIYRVTADHQPNRAAAVSHLISSHIAYDVGAYLIYSPSKI